MGSEVPEVKFKVLYISLLLRQCPILFISSKLEDEMQIWDTETKLCDVRLIIRNLQIDLHNRRIYKLQYATSP